MKNSVKLFTHLDQNGKIKMIDVGDKPVTLRKATAYGEIRIRPNVIRQILDRKVPKGDVLTVAKISGIMAAKRVGELIPLCHELKLDSVEMDFKVKQDRICVKATGFAHERTGVEMEVLTAVSTACLTIYDMVKAADKGMSIGPIYLLEKTGGHSGHYLRSDGNHGD